jgi:hypothetical protein
MGHRERDYAAESDPDVEYKYKDDSPTLLAAGLLEAQEITAGTNLIPIRMYPLIVDTVFRQGENVVQAALPSAQPGGARLFSEIDTEVVWILTGGFAELLRAQDKIKPEGGRGSDPLPNSAKKTWFRIGGESPGDSPNESNAVLSGAGLNQITLDLGAQNEGAAGSAAFNVTYLPFGAGNLEVFTDVFTDIDQNAAGWIIRNGVNDKAQDGKTVFPNTAEINSPWNDQTGDTGRNGNGAVAFTVEKKMISPIDLTSLVPAPAAGQPIAGYTSASGDQYSVAVSWIPASGAFEKGKSYTATVILTAKEGWAFGEGLGAGFFSHEAAASIVMLGGNNLVGLRLTFLLPDDSGDSDGDGFSDNMETANGFNPNNKNDNPAAAGSGSLTITGGTVKKLKAGQPITIEFTLGGFTGNANLYYTVAAQGAAAPALNTYPETSGRLVASGAQTLDVTDAVNAAAAALGKTWKDGYDVYLVLMQNGKAARGSVRVPKLVDLNVGG